MQSDRGRDVTAAPAAEHVYSPAARTFHWLTVLAILIQVPIGWYMVERGEATNFDATTNTLYSGHKLFGVAILSLVVLRLLYRLVRGAPPDEPTLAWWHKAAAHATHWGLYLLLLAVPVLGWIGVSYYGALGVLGGWTLPALTAKNPDKAEAIFNLHALAAWIIVALVAAHVGAALYHHFLRRDGVLRRMLPGLRPRE